MPHADIHTSTVICRQPGRYIGWPCIDRTAEGELLVVFSGDREAHVCPFGKTQMIRSGDDGRTWSDPVTINDTPLDDRDAGIVVLSDGTILLRWFCTYHHPDMPRFARLDEATKDRWRPHCDKITPDDVAQWTQATSGVTLKTHSDQRGYWLRRSTDAGRTWTDPMPIRGTSPKPAIELSDGSVLMIGNAGYDHAGRTSRVVLEHSTDRGASWRTISELGMFIGDEGHYLGEPHIVEASPGHIVALIRSEKPHRIKATDPTPDALYQADSHDGGQTWTDWRPTPMLGKPPHLHKLRDGRLLATYGRRFEPFGERACISSDQGASWDAASELIIRDDAPNGDLGYPATVQLGDGSLYTVYYQCERAGEKPCLMATHWSLAD